VPGLKNIRRKNKMLFETTENLTQDQIEDIRIGLNKIMLDDFIVFIDSHKILWHTDIELIK